MGGGGGGGVGVVSTVVVLVPSCFRCRKGQTAAVLSPGGYLNPPSQNINT